ncbi:MAG: hypothetical protein ABSG03_14065 [Bryobacteraceae bacterium]|jgi:hypothetical protein
MKTNTAFQYLATENPELLQQYFELRRRAYLLEYPWLPSTFGAPDDNDNASWIVVAVGSGVVAGGARLTLSTPQDPLPLPLEESGIFLQGYQRLAHLQLASKAYGEISRLAVSAETSEGLALSLGLTRSCCEIATSEGADVLFGICPPGPLRLNRWNAKRLALHFDTYGELSTVFGRDMTLCAFEGLGKRFAGTERDAA